MSNILDIYIDGACVGNPGPAAIGIVVKEGGKVVKKLSQAIGIATNNIAEYTALIYALKEALNRKRSIIRLHTDSELIYNQLKGTYKTKNEKIKSLFAEVQQLAQQFERIEMKQIPREQNRDADGLAKKAINKEQAKVVASKFYFEEESPSSKG